MRIKSKEDIVIITDLFKISYPFDWEYEYDNDLIHTIYDEHGIGAIQISSYTNTQQGFEYNIEKELVDHPSGTIIELKKIKAIRIVETDSDKKFQIIKWIVGAREVMIFCTYTVDLKYVNKNRYYSEKQIVEKIINTIEIISPAPNTG